MSKFDYWDECIAVSFEEHGIVATEEQIKQVAGDVHGAHENYGMAYPTPENPLISEVQKYKSAFLKEREKVICKECRGMGEIITHGPVHSGRSQCYKCHGDGRHAP